MEIPPKAKKSNHRNTESNSGNNNNTAASWRSSHARVGPRAQPPTHPSVPDHPASVVPAPASRPIRPPPIEVPEDLEAGGLGVSASQHGGAPGDLGGLGIAPGKGDGGAGGPVGPETPLPLRALERQENLMPQRVAEEPPEKIEQELMIGEIKVKNNIQQNVFSWSNT